VVVDEIDTLFSFGGLRKKIEPLLTDMAKMGRGLGVRVWIGIQRPTGNIVSKHMLDNFTTRAVLRLADKKASQVVGSPGADLLAGKGDMLFDGVRVQGFFLGEAELEQRAAMVCQKWGGDMAPNAVSGCA
jgi:DNA segregation ATPase FtsK/SpoIIIE-like protein